MTKNKLNDKQEHGPKKTTKTSKSDINFLGEKKTQNDMPLFGQKEKRHVVLSKSRHIRI